MQHFINALEKQKIKVVIFDLDQTACKAHSMGVLPRDNLRQYLDQTSSDFRQIIPVLVERGFKLAIATFNDLEILKYLPENGEILTKQPSDVVERNKTRIIAGESLVKEFLVENFGREIAEKFFIVAHNPNLHLDQEINWKNFHLKQICEYFGVKNEECVLFDDSLPNVQTFKGNAFLVDELKGFCLEDLTWIK